MSGHRSYRGVGLAYGALGLLVVWLSWPDRFPRSVVIPLAVLGLGMVYVDRWVNWVEARVSWSYGSVIAMAAMVLVPRGHAAFVGAVFGLLGALTDQEMDRPDLSRIAVNAGQLASAGWASGMVLDLIRPDSVSPSLQLMLGVLAATPMTTLVSGVMVVVAIRYRDGSWPSSRMAAAAVLLGWRKVPPTVATAAIASSVAVVGSPWIVFALIQVGALGAIPVVRARLEARRRDTMFAVTSALNARGVVGSAHDYLESTATTLGHRLGLNPDQIEQLRYVSLLDSMTDHFAPALPRSFEDQLRGLKENEFSSALLLGLPLNDVADGIVIRVAEAAAEYESLVRPVDGDVPMSSNEAVAELLRAGTRPDVVAALLDERPIPESYLRAGELDPGSPWRRPMRWLADRAS